MTESTNPVREALKLAGVMAWIAAVSFYFQTGAVRGTTVVQEQRWRHLAEALVENVPVTLHPPGLVSVPDDHRLTRAQWQGIRVSGLRVLIEAQRSAPQAADSIEAAVRQVGVRSVFVHVPSRGMALDLAVELLRRGYAVEDVESLLAAGSSAIESSAQC